MLKPQLHPTNHSRRDKDPPTPTITQESSFLKSGLGHSTLGQGPLWLPEAPLWSPQHLGLPAAYTPHPHQGHMLILWVQLTGGQKVVRLGG